MDRVLVARKLLPWEPGCSADVPGTIQDFCKGAFRALYTLPHPEDIVRHGQTPARIPVLLLAKDTQASEQELTSA